LRRKQKILLEDFGFAKHVGRNEDNKITQKVSLLHAFPKSVRMLAFIAITLAGIGSNFGSLDFDELSSPDFGVEQSALPATLEGSESVLLQRKALVPLRTEFRVIFPRRPTVIRGVPQSLQNFYCCYEHIPERGPPLLS
jgi:hypothetical protein